MQATRGQSARAGKWMDRRFSNGAGESLGDPCPLLIKGIWRNDAQLRGTNTMILCTTPDASPRENAPKKAHYKATNFTFLTRAIAADIGLTEPDVVTTPRSKSFASRLAKQIPTRSPALVNLGGCSRVKSQPVAIGNSGEEICHQSRKKKCCPTRRRHCCAPRPLSNNVHTWRWKPASGTSAWT